MLADYIQEQLATADVGQFKRLSRGLEKWVLGLEGTRVSEGIGATWSKKGQVEYAHSPGELLAVRTVNGQGTTEAFCALIEGVGVKVGHRLIRHGDSATLMLTPWWQEIVGSSVTSQANPQLPSFMTLALALATSGACIQSVDAAYAQAEAWQELHDYATRCAELQEELQQAQAQLASVEAGARTAEDVSAEALLSSRVYTDLSELPTWAQTKEANIVVLPRALNGAKKSLYRDPTQVFKALEFLAGPYREYRSGRLSKDQMTSALATSGMQLAGAVSPSVAGEQGDAYFVQWAGRRRHLDLHLLKGGGRDERYCLRVYFFWDAPSERVVVGWLPSHLDNSLS